MRLISTILVLLAAFIFCQIWAKDVTTRKRLKVEREKIERHRPTIVDTLKGKEVENITFAGFDKPLRSSIETVFATNRSGYHIKGLILECNYTDMSGRQLHNRTITIKCDIPSGQTRQIRFKSWDIQQAFHYRLSPKPRRSDGTPFDVKCICKAIIISKTGK